MPPLLLPPLLLVLLLLAAAAAVCARHAAAGRTLAARAAAAAHANDVPPAPAVATLAAHGRLVVAAYNAHLLPFPVAHDGDRRATALAAALPRALWRADVLVLTELISPQRRAALLAAVAPWWPYQSAAPTAWRRVSGGVHVLSRLPLARVATLVYAATDVRTADALAAKGAVYVQLAPCARRLPRLHVLATHMHAPDTAAGDAVRAAQRAELAAFLAAQRPRRRDVVLLAGDFNVDVDTAAARAALRMRPPCAWRGRHRHSVDPATNSLAAGAGATARLLDAVAPHAGYGPRMFTTAEVVPVRDERGGDLSDHHAVMCTATLL